MCDVGVTHGWSTYQCEGKGSNVMTLTESRNWLYPENDLTTPEQRKVTLCGVHARQIRKGQSVSIIVGRSDTVFGRFMTKQFKGEKSAEFLAKETIEKAERDLQHAQADLRREKARIAQDLFERLDELTDAVGDVGLFEPEDRYELAATLEEHQRVLEAFAKNVVERATALEKVREEDSDHS